jgi:hypothetical protein
VVGSVKENIRAVAVIPVALTGASKRYQLARHPVCAHGRQAGLTIIRTGQKDSANRGGVERKLTAILCADVFGYNSRLMRENEEATLGTLSSRRKIIDGLIAQAAAVFNRTPRSSHRRTRPG